MKFNYSVSEISRDEYNLLMADADCGDDGLPCTIDLGRCAGLDVDYDDELGMLVSGDDEHCIMMFVCLCHCQVGHDSYLPLYQALASM